MMRPQLVRIFACTARSKCAARGARLYPLRSVSYIVTIFDRIINAKKSIITSRPQPHVVGAAVVQVVA